MPGENNLDFSPYQKPGADNPLLAFIGDMFYFVLHLGALQGEVFLAHSFGVRYLRKRHLLLTSILSALVLAGLAYLRVRGVIWAVAFWMGALLLGAVHIFRAWYAEIICKRPLTDHTRSAGTRWVIGGLVSVLGLPHTPAWVRRFWEPLALLFLALPCALLSYPLAGWAVLCALCLSMKAELLYARWLTQRRDINDAETMARAIAGQRYERRVEDECYEVILVAPPPIVEMVEVADLEVVDLAEVVEAQPSPEPEPEPEPLPLPQPTPRPKSKPIRCRCRNCKARIVMPVKLAGQRVACPRCKKKFKVPVRAA